MILILLCSAKELHEKIYALKNTSMLTFEKKLLKLFKNRAKAKKFGVKKLKSLQLCLNLTVMAFKVLFKTF